MGLVEWLQETGLRPRYLLVIDNLDANHCEVIPCCSVCFFVNAAFPELMLAAWFFIASFAVY